jgi:hypothetical protein
MRKIKMNDARVLIFFFMGAANKAAVDSASIVIANTIDPKAHSSIYKNPETGQYQLDMESYSKISGDRIVNKLTRVFNANKFVNVRNRPTHFVTVMPDIKRDRDGSEQFTLILNAFD